MSKGSLLKYYLEGTAGSRADLGNVDAEDSLNTPVSSGKALLVRYSANANSLAPPQIQELSKRLHAMFLLDFFIGLLDPVLKYESSYIGALS